LYSIDLSGKNGVIVGVANDRSIAWGIARILAEAGARLALTYQNDRVKDRVTKLADTLDGAITMACDATDDAQVEDVFKQVGDNFGEISFLVHSIAFANKEDLTGSFSDTSREGFRIALSPPRRQVDAQRRQRCHHDV